jgi:hypothetical protein
MASILKAITNLPLPIIYGIVVILIIIPLIQPLGLPIPINPYAREFYDIVEDVPAGSKILFDPEFSPGTYATYNSVAIRFVEQCFRKGFPIYIYTNVALAPIIKSEIVSKAPSYADQVYGVDWIHFGFAPGSPDIAKATFSTDIRALFPVDFENGQPLDSYPMMAGVNGFADFYLLFDIYTGMATMDSNLRQWVLPNPDVIWLDSPNQVDAPSSVAYYKGGQMDGIIYGPDMYAAYEYLMNPR